jgi:probable phosphoglycerate mutase
MRIYLLRHGQVAANREMRYVGRADQPLTEVGHDQAQALSNAFRDVRLDQVRVSPRTRARQTASSLLERHALGIESLRTEERLAEQDFGSWEGMSRSEIAALGRSSVAELAAFDRSPEVRAPGGESLEEVARRAEEVLVEAHEEDVEQLMLVSHVGPTKCLLARVLGLSLLEVRRFFLDPGTFSVVDWPGPDSRGVLRMFNVPGHREWLGSRWMRGHRDPA